MILRPALCAALLAGSALPLLAAEGGPIRGGEHDGFSRIVMIIDPTTEWSLENGTGSVTIRFPGRSLAFGTGEVFARMPATRIRDVRAVDEAGGTAIHVALGCDCRVTTAFVGARYLALDVADPGAVPPSPPESAAAREEREAKVVVSAEEALLRQIERAAGQGIVELTAPSDTPPPAPSEQVALREPAPPPRPRSPATAPAAAAPDRSDALGAGGVAAIFRDEDQVEATTVYDRDTASAIAARKTVDTACLPDDALDIAAWSNGRPFRAQLSVVRRGLVGEFDAPRPEDVLDLARLYVRFGFGAEARATLAAFDPVASSAEAPVLADLARVVDGEPAAPDGPLSISGTCPGLHGLWLALGGRAPAFVDDAQFVSVRESFEVLPVDLRRLLGPGLVGRLVAARRPAEARVILDATVRAGLPADEPTPAIAIANGRVLAAEGRTREAIAAFVPVADGGGPLATDAMVAMTETALAAGLPVPERTILDLRAAALLGRGTAREAPLRALLAEALAARADLPAAIEETRAAMADLPASADRFGSIAVASLADADPAAVGRAAYADTVLGARDLLAGAPARDPARRQVASHLVALGLPAPALAVLAPAVVLDDPAARLIAAEAEIGLGNAEAARGTLAGLDGSRAAVLTARSYMLEGRYPEAVAALKAAGLDTEAAAYAWPSGDWARVDAADPERSAMAGYMAARSGEAPAPPADAAGTSAAAFQAPIPSLDRPSLHAARELLSSGPGVAGFIGGVIAGDAEPAPAGH